MSCYSVDKEGVSIVYIIGARTQELIICGLEEELLFFRTEEELLICNRRRNCLFVDRRGVAVL